MTSVISTFDQLIQTIRALRADDGCPWDRKQSTTSLEKYLREEFDEIIAAIEKNDHENLCEELGDFLYLIIMLAEINQDVEQFNLRDVILGINDKLIRRHPHVFTERRELDEITLRKQWQKIKEEEKDQKK